MIDSMPEEESNSTQPSQDASRRFKRLVSSNDESGSKTPPPPPQETPEGAEPAGQTRSWFLSEEEEEEGQNRDDRSEASQTHSDYAGQTLGWLLSEEWDGKENTKPDHPPSGSSGFAAPGQDSDSDEHTTAVWHNVTDSGASRIDQTPTDPNARSKPNLTGGWYREQDGDNSTFGGTTPGLASSEPPGSRYEPDRNDRQGPTPPPPVGRTPTISPPALDGQGMPLPRRVDEIDIYATRVTSSAYAPPSQNAGATPSRGTAVSAPTRRVRRPAKDKTLGCFLRILIGSVFGIIFLLLITASFLLYRYYTIAATLPNVADLRERSSQFETTRILDRNGNLLYEILDPNAGRRTYVTLDKISPYIIAATLATEDKEFYDHPGFDPIAILRALWQNYTNQEIVSGASTITQQLARMLLFTPEERGQRTYDRKAREIILAAEITRRYSKDEILELYLNENFYGNRSYGVEAAAEAYFNTTSDKLTLGQGTFLAGLPQAPSVYDIFNNRELTLQRQQQVLVMTFNASQEQGCIYVSTQAQRVCVDAGAATQAYGEIQNYTFTPAKESIRFPHWVNYVRSLLEAQYDPQTIYRSGFTVQTTIDPVLQEEAERIVREQVASLADNHATDGALVAIRPSTGEILAMVGSADFENEAISGQVNMAVSPRQPGSSIKPLTYVAAFEKGWTPGTLIWDVPSEFPPSGDPNDGRPPYEPVNYDGRFHGPVTARYALANSYNIPAVKTLNFVGIYDDPQTPGEDGFLAFARRLGITTLNRTDYGLSLTLGGGDVSLLELTGAYAVYANQGRRVPPYAINRVVDYEGKTVFEQVPFEGTQVVRTEHAYLISSILSDNNARTPAFGANSILNLPFQVAAKTGTTNDFRDNWTLGYTPDLAVGVWVGNADYTPMQNTTGLTGAAPIWSEFMQYAIQQLTNGAPKPFTRPAGITDKIICSVSGTEPSQWCPQQRSEMFVLDQPPLPKEQDLWRNTKLDTWTGLEASAACPDFSEEKFVINVTDPWAVRWLRENSQGQTWASDMGFPDPIFFVPQRACQADDPHPILEFSGLSNDQLITSSPLDIFARVDATSNFSKFRLEYGTGDKPDKWQVLLKGTEPVKSLGKIYTWDLKDVTADRVTLRLYMQSPQDTYAERRVTLRLQIPTPTPTQTPTEMPTPTQTLTLTPSLTFTPSVTPTPTLTETPTPTPTMTPTSE